MRGVVLKFGPVAIVVGFAWTPPLELVCRERLAEREAEAAREREAEAA